MEHFVTRLTSGALGAGLGATAVTGVFGLTAFSAHAATHAPSYCPFSIIESYAVATNQPAYREDDPVVFCIADNTRMPLFLSGLHPWRVENAIGDTVYTPPPGSPNAYPQGTTFFADQWNQMLNDGAPAGPGAYTVAFPSIPGSPSATFAITATAPAQDSASSTASDAAALAQLSAHLNALQAALIELHVRITQLSASLHVLLMQ